MARKWGVFFRQVESFLRQVGKGWILLVQTLTINPPSPEAPKALTPDPSPKVGEGRKPGEGMRAKSLSAQLRCTPVKFFFLGILGLIFALGIPILWGWDEVTQAHSVPPVAQAANPQQLIEKARELYRRQEYPAAVEALQQAADIYSAQNNYINQSLALSYLGLAYQKLGQWQEAETAISASLQLLPLESGRKSEYQARAIAWNHQGQLQLAMGQAENAWNSWQEAAANYRHIGDNEGLSGMLVNQAQALAEMGYYRRACSSLIQAIGMDAVTCDQLNDKDVLEKVLSVIKQEADEELRAIQGRTLGNVLLAMGEVETAVDVLKTSQTLTLGSYQNSLSLLALGNAEAAWGQKQLYFGKKTEATSHLENALKYYRDAAAVTPDKITKVLADINLLSLSAKMEMPDLAPKNPANLLPKIQENLAAVPKTQAVVKAQIHLACTLMRCDDIARGDMATNPMVAMAEIDDILSQALQAADDLGDKKLKSYAVGTLAKGYERRLKKAETASNPDWMQAEKLTQEALDLAGGENALEIAYQWQWQLGRLRRQVADLPGAIGYYEAAVKAIESVRSDLQRVNSDVQFSFRDNAEPIYRDLVDLLLPESEPKPSDFKLKQAIYLIDSLQLADLENYLQCQFNRDFIAGNQNPSSAIYENIQTVLKARENTALIYTIVLPKRLIAITISGDKLLYNSNSLTPEILSDTIKNARSQIRSANFAKDDVKFLQVLYESLVKPFTNDFDADQIHNLVFVLDSSLRSIPMAALYDGQDYLVKKYAVALAYSAQLMKPNNEGLNPGKILIAGSTKTRPPFGELNFVPLQIERIRQWVNNPQVLSQGNFTKEALRQELGSSVYSTIHLITHGKFSADPKETFIFTDDDSNNPDDYEIRLNEFGEFLQIGSSSQPLGLLVLSACETASGDSRAVLGIAGVAVKSGANATIAPLWKADQESATNLVAKFYEYLATDNISKAEALRRAQASLLADNLIPYHWAAFTLVGY